MTRHLDWDGCWNARDLGGLPAADGGRTRHGALVRSDALDRLSPAGWAALEEHGVRTVVDLRNHDELSPDASPRPETLATVHIPLDGQEHHEFWELWASGPQFGTPLYYGAFLDRFPERTAAAVAAFAHAPPGGVLVHCVGGRDRTGLVTLLLLALAGVPPDEIAADYALSSERLRARYAALGEDDQGPLLADYLAEQGTTAEQVIADTLASLDPEAHLRAGGLDDDDIVRARDRLVAA